MPVADTELLFALSAGDPKHHIVLKLVEAVKNIKAPDASILEFQTVLKGRGRAVLQVRRAMLALGKARADNSIIEVKTIDTNLLILQADIEQKYHLSYFDSLIAAIALTLDDEIISDDLDFDGVPDLRRRPISGL